MPNNYTFTLAGFPVGLGHSLGPALALGASEGSGDAVYDLLPALSGVSTLLVDDPTKEVVFRRGGSFLSAPKADGPTQRRAYRVVVDEGYTVSALAIRPDGTYASTVRKDSAWFGTTTTGVALGEKVEGIVVDVAESEEA
ncbi:hypothetical protein Q8F55_004209 [Vanrija albida]|uniref:Uncharacterized protein n=1 Tax=Vanrija albida TaxID=181172 RepID=A0ABR3Q634_9TREE